ncbi:polyprotein [Metarhizium guizhouense ARSEF 977]|uniref:Polyprotein n=1 Tax=Metarhizium guizhouense (strain ARSEF 977) TaxID=1276136 RepID=A0A0B4G5E4_METGA|nr:polyprotein [Metarhizium guizhouense ARSEF 977]
MEFELAKNGKGKEAGSNKRKREDSDNQSHSDNRDTERCYACGSRTHDTTRCFYVNKNIAPEYFQGNQTIKAGIEHRLANDKTYAEEIRPTAAAFFTGRAHHTAFAITQYPLKNSALLDSASTIHIFNEISRFNNFRTALPGDCVTAGDHLVPIQGYGDVDIRVQGQRGFDILRLHNVALCENFAANLVSLRQLRQHGYWWDNRLNHNCLRAYNGNIVCKVLDRHDQFVLEYIPMETSRQSFFTRRNTFNSWTGRQASSADARKWHLRLGHPGPKALEHLVNCSTGTKIKGLTTVECDHCGVSKVKRQVSRKPRDTENAPGLRLAIDFHDLEEDHEGRDSVMFITDRWSGYVWDFYLTDRKADTIRTALEILFGILDRRYQIKPRVIECDNEIYEKRHQLRSWLESLFILIEPSAKYTPAQNGGAERSGGILEIKARAMRIGAGLPNYLWVEIFKAAVYLYNRTPKYILRWQSPYGRFFTFLANRDGVANRQYKPDLRHLRVYGCKAFAMTKDAMAKRKRRQKLNPRAWIGYLVGYQSTNIYRIWNPWLGKVISTRDVIFNEDEYFHGDLEQLKDDIRELNREELMNLLQEIKEPDQTEETSQEESHGEDDLVVGTDHDWDLSIHHGVDDQTREGNLRSNPEDHPNMRVAPSVTEDPRQVPYALGSGESLPDRISAKLGVTDRIEAIQQTRDLLSLQNPNISPQGGTPPRQDANGWETSPPSMLPDTRTKANAGVQFQSYPTPPLTEPTPAALMAACFQGSNMNPEAKDQGNNCDPTGIELQSVVPTENQQTLNTISNIETWKAAFAAGRHAAPIGKINGKPIDRAKFLRILSQPKSLHRSQLPAPPRSHGDLATHLMGTLFIEAERIHLKSHKEMQSWIEISKSDQSVRNQQVLDCMWVYTYKFDKHGRFQKCKARLVVRGDQQAKSIHEDTYASTLAGRSFRILMAIAARFDLELVQYDAVNAFVNAKMDRDIFMKMPPGHRKPGRILRLQRALYGLRCSPLLWQKELTRTLEELGFEKVPQEPCCMMKNGIIIFFYVDDIVLAYQKNKENEAKHLTDQLQRKYQLTGGNALQWFLGMEIIRDRGKRLIWLSQSAYIDKIANLATPSPDRWPTVPMSGPEPLPYEERASIASIRRYQKKIGSILYAAVVTRPDIAFAVSRLARFNTNPSDEHHAAADKVIHYLKKTRSLALQLGGGDEFLVASDASFADNSIDRKSSQGYVMQLFGGTIGWRANKQDTVTTSTTEAELLALSQATKESMFVSRLLKEIGIRLDSKTIRIQCDNQQTIKLVNKEVGLLQTKLRHVNIHNHWLRQEAEKGTISVNYVPTGEMVADGLTKALSSQPFKGFVERLGLVNIEERLSQRELEEMNTETLQDRLELLQL